MSPFLEAHAMISQHSMAGAPMRLLSTQRRTSESTTAETAAGPQLRQTPLRFLQHTPLRARRCNGLPHLESPQPGAPHESAPPALLEMLARWATR